MRLDRSIGRLAATYSDHGNYIAIIRRNTALTGDHRVQDNQFRFRLDSVEDM